MLAALVLLLLTFALLLWPVAVTGGIASSLSYCLSALVPSLFPFMVLCGFAVESSAALWLSRPLGFCARYLFRLPDCCAAPVLMGLIGGYPAGARGTSLLLEKGRITEKEARRMLMFCVNPGLAFTVTYLGIGVFGRPRAGLPGRADQTGNESEGSLRGHHKKRTDGNLGLYCLPDSFQRRLGL